MNTLQSKLDSLNHLYSKDLITKKEYKKLKKYWTKKFRPSINWSVVIAWIILLILVINAFKQLSKWDAQAIEHLQSKGYTYEEAYKEVKFDE